MGRPQRPHSWPVRCVGALRRTNPSQLTIPRIRLKAHWPTRVQRTQRTPQLYATGAASHLSSSRTGRVSPASATSFSDCAQSALRSAPSPSVQVRQGSHV
eukprot:scaffold9818_cov63-Phaeocystis_antarctica.AAC.2